MGGWRPFSWIGTTMPGLAYNRTNGIWLWCDFRRGAPVCATWPQLEFSGPQSDSERRGAQPMPLPPTDVSLQFSQAADTINQGLFVMQIQVTGMPPPLNSNANGHPAPDTRKKVYPCWSQWHKQSCWGQEEEEEGRKRAQVWLGRRREAAFRLKCFWSQKHYKQLLGIKNQRL